MSDGKLSLDATLDLRPYVAALQANWKRIAAASLISALVALVVSFLLPPRFRATALVAITEPRQLVQFDPRFEALQDGQRRLQAYPELASSDELLFDLWGEWRPSLPKVRSFRDFQKRVEARPGTDPGLLHLQVTYREADKAAALANAWAERFVTRTNELYGDQGGEQLRFFEAQLAEAEAELAEAEQALVDYQETNRGILVNNVLQSLQQTHAGYLADSRRITFLRHDIKNLRDQMVAQSGDPSTSFADQLTALSLQIKTFNAETSMPLELQVVSADTLTRQDRAGQVAFLDNLLVVLDGRGAENRKRLARLEPEILTLQQSYQTYLTQFKTLERNLTVAEETYTALSRKVDEERITSQDTTAGVRLAGRAVPPDKPVRPKKGLNTVLGAALGLLLSAFAVLGSVWWRTELRNAEILGVDAQTGREG